MPIVRVLTAASGLDILLRNSAGVLTNPASIFYDIKEPANSLVADDIVPFQRSTGHFDARTTVIPSGFNTSEPWIITWTWTSPGGITNSKSEEFSVATGLEGGFSGIEEIAQQIKTDIAATATELSDEAIKIFIIKSLDRLNIKLMLEGTDAELSFDDGNGVVVPTPSSSIKALIVMQAECLIVKKRQSDAVRKSIRVRDGESEIDTTAGFGGHGDVVNNVCDELKDAIEAFLRSQGGPEQHGDLIWHGNQRLFEEANHDGQAFRRKDMRSPFDDDLGFFNNGPCAP